MPVQTVRRRIVNPANRRRNAAPARKLTAAQVLAGFGGKPAQERALAAAGRATNTSARKRPAKRKNPSQALRVALSNPSPKKKEGEQMQRKRRSSSTRRRSTARRSNPTRTRAARPKTRTRTVVKYRTRRANPVASRRRSSRRANPPRNLQAFKMLRAAAMVSVGAVGTRLSVQAALGSKNTGSTGIFANLLTSFLLGGIVSMVTKKKEDGQNVTIGGIAGTLLRLAQDTTPLGKQASLSGVGDYGVAGLGKYGPGLIMHPSQTQNGEAGRPNMVPDQLRPQLVAAPAAGMSGYSRNRRFAARF